MLKRIVLFASVVAICFSLSSSYAEPISKLNLAPTHELKAAPSVAQTLNAPPLATQGLTASPSAAQGLTAPPSATQGLGQGLIVTPPAHEASNPAHDEGRAQREARHRAREQERAAREERRQSRLEKRQTAQEKREAEEEARRQHRAAQRQERSEQRQEAMQERARRQRARQHAREEQESEKAHDVTAVTPCKNPPCGLGALHPEKLRPSRGGLGKLPPKGAEGDDANTKGLMDEHNESERKASDIDRKRKETSDGVIDKL